MTHDIDLYLRRLRAALRSLPEAEREEILAETRSHLREREEADGQAGVEAALRAFGPAEAYAGAFVDEYRLRAASAGGGPLELAGVLLGQATRRVTACFGFVLAAVAYLFAGAFVLIAAVEVIRPDLAGMWIGPDVFVLGVINPASRGPDTAELLGPALIPLMLVAAPLALALGYAISQATVRHLLRKH
ncbi:hypothetical protein GCM10011367_25200 [Marinicauda pacifica]|jgi:hypothetical protein|uniref:DUF1700 domain-containing protein n=1 Tax=Marinicauda pacifica TaxID=1133559 RepID=A0A4S2H9E3_9PROT|nr:MULTISPECIES: hypothetical protein [Marinicauda]TGY92485.1 hypothetical protein E5162_12675 [Marinicauda pacifica]GGE49289.1 hypothetical protein GCM10011367_25200 [Marinicauda pacifica]